MPLTAMSRSNSCSSSARAEPEERHRVLAHVRVHPQRDVPSGLGHPVERGDGHLHLVADALHVDDDAVGVLFEQAAAEEGDHDMQARAAGCSPQAFPAPGPRGRQPAACSRPPSYNPQVRRLHIAPAPDAAPPGTSPVILA